MLWILTHPWHLCRTPFNKTGAGTHLKKTVGDRYPCNGSLRRYLPDGVCAEKLAELERWRCDSRTAACACLLLLCATREVLTDGAQAMALAKALTEVCSALGRHSAHDSMAWGCDLDPGNTSSQLSTPPGKISPRRVHIIAVPTCKEFCI